MSEHGHASVRRPDPAEQITAMLGPNIFRWAAAQLPRGVVIDDVRFRDLISVSEADVLDHVKANGFDPRVVWIEEGTGGVDDRICLARHDRGWRVFYIERGQTSNEAVFAERDDALAEIVRRLVRSARVSLNHRYWHAHGLPFPCGDE